MTALFCRCGRHHQILERMELREIHLLFEILEEEVQQTALLTEIRDLLKKPQSGVEVALVIPVGGITEQ